MAELPEPVAAAISKMREGGSILDHNVAWRPDAWRAVPIPDSEALVSDLIARGNSSGGGYRISRSDVIELGTTDARLFLAAMIFGFGTVNYGAHRVTKMVEDTGSSFAEHLAGIIQAGAVGAAEGWDAIRSPNTKIRNIGIAFGTKVTYFASLRENPGRPLALIADANTSWGAWEAFGIRRSVELRSSYLEYIETARSFHGAGYRPDEIEYGLFNYGKTIDRST